MLVVQSRNSITCVFLRLEQKELLIQTIEKLATWRMGVGGYLWIINATPRKFNLVCCSSYQMTSWEFRDIPSQSQERFYIEFRDGIFTKTADDAGEATFQLEDSSSTFKLQAQWPYKNGECGLKIDWSGTDTNLYGVFPPALHEDGIGKLGWIRNGNLSLLIIEKRTATFVSTCLPDENASIVSSATAIPSPTCGPWMEHYCSLLEKLTLTEMTVPGTHNSGTYQPVSIVGSLWVKTQGFSLAQQLNCGIRCLDLRIGQNSPGDYVICHDTWRTRYSLAKALKEVTEFIDSTTKEIVILDFHRFVNLGREDYDYNQLKQQIASALSGYCLLPRYAGDTLETIWSSTRREQRIVAAWNTSNPDSYMWPGVNQRWYCNADSLRKLYGFIKSDMQNPPGWMWATCSFLTPSLSSSPKSNAKTANPTITNWYFGGSVFCEKANIISVDFFNKYSNVVQASIVANLLKAGRK
jgi:hypothetical protein